MQGMQGIYFQFRLVPALVTLAGVALFIHLGQWQGSKAALRAQQMQQYETRMAQPPANLGTVLIPADHDHWHNAPVRVQGVYEADKQFFIDNQQFQARPGLHVITPLKIDGSTTRVLVNRGWVAWGASRAVLPSVATPAGAVAVTGVAVQPEAKKAFMTPDRPSPMVQLWERLDLERFVRQNPGALQPVVVLQAQQNAPNDGLVRQWPAPQNKVMMHQGYSLQWYGMAAALVIFFLVASVRRKGKVPP